MGERMSNNPNRRAAFLLCREILGSARAAAGIVAALPEHSGIEMIKQARNRAISAAGPERRRAREVPPMKGGSDTDHSSLPLRNAWNRLSHEEQKAAWNALCGRPAKPATVREAIGKLRGSSEKEAPSLPSEEDIP